VIRLAEKLSLKKSKIASLLSKYVFSIENSSLLNFNIAHVVKRKNKDKGSFNPFQIAASDDDVFKIFLSLFNQYQSHILNQSATL